MVLESYSYLFSMIASSAMVPLLLSPSLICKDFIKKGSADHLKPFIFVSGLIRSSVFLQFGKLANLSPLIRVHTCGFLLYTIYFTLYYKYCSSKRPALISLTKAVIFISILLGYVNYKPESLMASYFQFIATVIHLGLLAVPLLNLKQVIRKKSTAGMPFPVILCATIVSFSWLLFGISINNGALICQMLIGLILTGTQLSLFVIYPSKEIKTKTKKEKKN